jgi:hypothetical protein
VSRQLSKDVVGIERPRVPLALDEESLGRLSLQAFAMAVPGVADGE